MQWLSQPNSIAWIYLNIMLDIMNQNFFYVVGNPLF